MTVSLLQSKSILKNEYLLIRLLDRTFQRACTVRTLDYKNELPKNVKKEFGRNTFALQLDKIITEIIRESLKYADKTMKKMAAAKVNESYILTEEAVRISKDLSQEASESIVRILQDDAIYYEHPKALSKRIVDLWGGEKYRAERFARTFTADVATATTVARYRQYGVRYMEFDAEIDDRTTDQCRCLNGVQFDLEKDSVDRYRPPLHMNCRSGLVPLTDDEYQPDMEFENRNFNNALDNPDDVSRAFKNIDTFNDKYRVSKFKLDQDLGARIMFDKGFSVGISGPDLSGLVDKVVPDVAEKVYDGKTYVLTPSELKKVTVKEEDIPRLLDEWDAANKEKLGKKWGLKKRDYAASLQGNTEAYRIGLGQGRLDRINGIAYVEKGKDKAFNRGYYTGWNDNPSGWLKDAIAKNPNYAHLK